MNACKRYSTIEVSSNFTKVTMYNKCLGTYYMDVNCIYKDLRWVGFFMTRGPRLISDNIIIFYSSVLTR